MPFSTTQLPDYIGLFRARKFPMVVEMPVVTHLERGYCQGGRDRQEDWGGIVSTLDRATARVWTGTLSVKPDICQSTAVPVLPAHSCTCAIETWNTHMPGRREGSTHCTREASTVWAYPGNIEYPMQLPLSLWPSRTTQTAMVGSCPPYE